MIKKSGVADIIIGSNLRRARIEKGLTQKQVAAKIGITFQQLQKYERGDNRIPSSRLYAFHVKLKIPLENLFVGLDELYGHVTKIED